MVVRQLRDGWGSVMTYGGGHPDDGGRQEPLTGPLTPGGRPGNLRRHQLIDRLNRAVEELDQLMAFLVALAESQTMDPMRMQYPSGEPAMAPLVVAQAQALAALAQLHAAPAEDDPRRGLPLGGGW